MIAQLTPEERWELNYLKSLQTDFHMLPMNLETRIIELEFKIQGKKFKRKTSSQDLIRENEKNNNL